MLEIMDVFITLLCQLDGCVARETLRFDLVVESTLYNVNPPEPWDLQRQLEAPGAPALC